MPDMKIISWRGRSFIWRELLFAGGACYRRVGNARRVPVLCRASVPCRKYSMALTSLRPYHMSLLSYISAKIVESNHDAASSAASKDQGRAFEAEVKELTPYCIIGLSSVSGVPGGVSIVADFGRCRYLPCREAGELARAVAPVIRSARRRRRHQGNRSPSLICRPHALAFLTAKQPARSRHGGVSCPPSVILLRRPRYRPASRDR